MAVFHFKFNRILSLKKREKDQALFAYQEALGKFEKAAGRLYELLKQKEDLEARQMEKLALGLPINEIRSYQDYIENLEKIIQRQQMVVINARTRMHLMQERLMEKNIEVKKFEKIRAKDAEKFFEQLKATENKNMDEVSIQTYLNREIR
jgi:flagellar FliJ protein